MTTFTVRRSRVRSTDILRAQFVIHQGSITWSGVGVWATQPIRRVNASVSFTGSATETIVPIVVRHGSASFVGSGDLATGTTRIAVGSVAWSGSLMFGETATAAIVSGSVGWVGSGTLSVVSHAVFDCTPGPAVLFHSRTYAVSSHAKTVAVLNCP